MITKADELKSKILGLVSEYTKEKWPKKKFIAGEDRVSTGGRVFDDEELINLVDSSLDFWLTGDKYAEKFEVGLQNYLDVNTAILCNSGSSANLLAVTALTSMELERAMVPGSEVITVAAAFPTTVNPIIQNKLVPVFIDIELDSYNADMSYLEEALSSKTKAVMLAHTLGHPFEVKTAIDFCRKNNLWLIEDNCDGLGSKYDYTYTGTLGDIATLSFFPAHHITTGQGGAVLTTHAGVIPTLVKTYRDWGRACWCKPGYVNSCRKRYSWDLGTMPFGYDHKYIYTHIGYNLEMTDMQASIGLAQLDKLPEFGIARRRNWEQLNKDLADLSEYFVLPKKLPKADPSWFGFAIRVKQDAPFTRDDVIQFLNANKIDSRLLFAGNITRQPAYQYDVNYRKIGDLKNTDDAMNNVFWIGVYPGLGNEEINYVVETLHTFVEDNKLNV